MTVSDEPAPPLTISLLGPFCLQVHGSPLPRLGAWPHASTIDGDRIGLFGFSRGGYTGLAVIGGHPNFARGAARS